MTSTFPKTLKRTDLPYITGKPALGPIAPNPKIAVPSEIIPQHFLKLYEDVSVLINLIRFLYEKQCFMIYML